MNYIKWKIEEIKKYVLNSKPEIQTSDVVRLGVEKITSDTYAGETTYTGEQFILLDIYPKTNGTVSITYGGLTKTITDTSGVEEPNAQQVFFGTFNGISDSVETPLSGELVIEGDYVAFGCSNYNKTSKDITDARCLCVTYIQSFGKVLRIPDNAFSNGMLGCSLTSIAIPNSVTSIGDWAFACCENLESIVIPNSVTSIGENAFLACPYENIEIPKSVISIGAHAFNTIDSLKEKPPTLKMVKVLSETPPELLSNSDTEYNNFSFGSLTDEGCVLEQITVPKGCSDVYKNATGWSYYADYIVEAS